MIIFSKILTKDTPELACESEVRSIILWVHSLILTLHLSLSCLDRLVQERRNSSALAMELRLSCTNPLISNIMQ